MDLDEQVQQLRLVHRLEKEAERDLMDTETMQGRRWELLRRVAGYAGDSYTAMRIDVVDERLRDQGAPTWLGAMLTIGVTLIPVTALTGGFLAGLTTTTQKLLTRSDRTRMQSAQSFLETAGSFDSVKWSGAAHEWLRLQDTIKQTEDMVAHYTKKWLAPELSNKLQEGADALLHGRGKPPFGQDVLLLQGLEPILQGQGKQSIQKDVPLVQIKKSLDFWIETQILAEDIASKKIRQQIRDLADIATSPDPRKEAQAIQEASKGPKVYGPPAPKVYGPPAPKVYGPPAPLPPPLPKTNEAALDQLKKLRTQLAHTLVESRSTPSSKARWDLQLAIESMIWASSYVFKPREVLRAPDDTDIKTTVGWVIEESPAPLPEDLWKRLIERFPVPAGKGESPAPPRPLFADQVITPDPAEKGKTDEETKLRESKLRLSHYFSKLYLDIDRENNEMVKRFRVPGPRQQ